MLQYSAAVINVPFDSDYKNVIDFGSEQEKRGYFSDILGDTPFSPLSNFNVGNGITTTVVYDAPIGFSLFNQLNVNYMIIKDTNNNWFYYFITNVQQLSANRFRYDISIDIFNQYFDIQYFTNTKYLIKRAHLDRFNDDRTISDYMFSTPPIKVDETYNKNISNDIYASSNNINDEVKYTQGWKYIFINNNKHYNNINDNIDGVYRMGSPLGESEFGLIVEPVGGLWTFKDGTSLISIDTDGDTFENNFRKSNNNASYIYAIKILPFHPFDNSTSIDYENHIIEFRNSLTNLSSTEDIPAVTSANLIPKFYMGKAIDTLRIPSQSDLTNKDYYEDNIYPKLYDGGKSITLGFFTEEFTINTMRFIKQQVSLDAKFVCKFPVTTIDSSILITLDKNFRTEYTKNISPYYGLLSKMDTAIQVSNTAYEEYVANNRNFNLQFDANIKLAKAQYFGNIANKAINSIGSGVVGGITGNPFAIKSSVGEIGSLISDTVVGGLDLANKRKQFDYNIDNYKGAPSVISSGQPQLYLQLENKIAPYIAQVDILPQAKKLLLDTWRLYGYEYNNLDTIDRWYNSRKYHNYIEANVEDITAPWSLQVKEQFKRAFASGVRFWHYNGGQWNGIEQYVNNNYERKFDNA